MSRIILAAVGLLAVVGPGWAEDPKGEDEVAKAFGKIAALGPGVHHVKKDAKGRVVSCVIVGQSRISTVLGRAKGLETARQRVGLAVKAEFVKWLKEKVSVYAGTDDESVVLIEGSEESGQRALKESGKAVEKTQAKMEAVADGLLRGLEVLHTEVSREDKTYTVVMGWDAQTAKAIDGVVEANREKSGSPPGGKGESPAKKDPPAPAKPAAGDQIQDRKVTSPNAKRYLPD